MAKDSFILGATRGAVGNIVVRRSNGRTVISSKPSSVANPRTYAQAEVRMRMSAVSKFYSPLSSYLEQGVQGKNTLNSQSAFTSAAILAMKENGWSAAKGEEWFPFPFRLAKGSVPPVVIGLDGDWLSSGNQIFNIDEGFGVLAEDITTIGALARFFKTRHGIPVDRFQLTFVAAYQQYATPTSYYYYPVVARLELDAASTAALSSVDRFINLSQSSEGDSSWVFTAAGNTSFHCCGIALILSYYDGKKWVRSTSDMLVDPSLLATSALAYDANVATFMDSSAVSDPEGRVYLDGYTRQSSGGSGGGSDFDPSVTAYLYGDTATTAKPVSVTTAAVGSATCLAVVMSDGTTHVVMGNEKMSSFGKAFSPTGGAKTTLTNEQRAAAVSADGNDDNFYDFYAWLAEQTGLTLSYFMSM